GSNVSIVAILCGVGEGDGKSFFFYGCFAIYRYFVLIGFVADELFEYRFYVRAKASFSSHREYPAHMRIESYTSRAKEWVTVYASGIYGLYYLVVDSTNSGYGL